MKKITSIHSLGDLLEEYGEGRLFAVLETESFTLEAQRLNGTLSFHHLNADHDEVVVCLAGMLRISTAEGELVITAGEIAHIPRGMEHGPIIGHEAELLVLEGND